MKENRLRKQIPTVGKEPLRLIALSDGLFATVLTLLVLDLRIPDGLNIAGGNMTTFARWIGPHLFSYLMTFFVAGNYWLAHHRDFEHIIRFDRHLLAYNLIFLLFVGLLPFTTASISQVSATRSSFPPYWAMYAANFVLAGIMLSVIWLYAMSHGLVDPGTTRQESRYIMVRQIVNPAVFLLSIGAEYLFPQAFLGPWFLLALLPGLFLVERIFAPLEPERPSRLAAWPRRIWQAGITLLWILIFGLAIWVLSR
jgi:TMEM175 potassium channel family protein